VGVVPTFRVRRVGIVMDAEALVRPVVEGAGFELFDVTFGGGTDGRPTLRVTVDRDGGLDLNTIAALSDKIARRLDLESFGDGRYELEVSSPGIEHPLKTPTHYARAVGSRVKIKTDDAVDDAHIHEGVLVDVGGERLELDVDGVRRTIPLTAIRSGRTVADWSSELKGSAV
jgi:ribosome maturation factor RimP